MVKIQAEGEYYSLLPVEFTLSSTVVYIPTRTYSALFDVTFGLTSSSKPTPQYNGALSAEFALTSVVIYDPAGPLYSALAADTFVGSSNIWTNPTNAEGPPDGSDAVASGIPVGQSSTYLSLTEYDVSFNPSGTVLGVTVSVTCTAGTLSQIITAHLVYLGALIGTPIQMSPAVSGTPAVMTFGGTSDTWGASLTPTIVNDSSFGLWIKTTNTGSGATSFAVDAVQIAVNG